MSAGDLASIAAAIALAITWCGIVAFFSLWVHRADGNRALTMGLYIFFGAVAVFGFILGFRSYREGVGPEREAFEWMAVGVAVSVGLIPPTRRLLARLLPFDPAHWADVTGLLVMLAIAAFSLVGMFYENTLTASVGYLEIALQAALLLVLAFFGVGLFVKRSFSEALQRLGLTRVTGREVGLALLLVLAGLVVSGASAYLVQWLQPDLHERIQENLRLTTDEIDSAWAAIGFGLLTGASEELLFRGALQPRFGLLFTAIVFALVHMQYGASVITVGVFAVGILLGLERKYLNTTACVITHAVYNTLAALISVAAG